MRHRDEDPLENRLTAGEGSGVRRLGAIQGPGAALLGEISGELTSRGAAAMSDDSAAEVRVRAAVEAFFAFVEERPAAARVLLVVPAGAPEALAESRRVQARVTARLAALLAAEPGLLPSAPDRERRLELFAEFAKQGLHGLAEWWAGRPDVPRRVIVDAAMGVLWTGLGAQFTPRS